MKKWFRCDLGLVTDKGEIIIAEDIKELIKERDKYFQEIARLKERIDKAIEYCKSKIKEQKELTDYSKYYLENYDKAINLTHSTHSGVMLETIKSTTIKRYEDILEILRDKENE